MSGPPTGPPMRFGGPPPPGHVSFFLIDFLNFCHFTILPHVIEWLYSLFCRILKKIYICHMIVLCEMQRSINDFFTDKSVVKGGTMKRSQLPKIKMVTF